MTQSYLQTCILDALDKAKGNQNKAQKIIALLAMEDPQLLQALAKPHLTGIVAHAVGRIAIQENAKKAGAYEDLPTKPVVEKGTQDQNGFGIDLLKALGGANVPKFGMEDAAPRLGRKQASQQHVNALNLMANKSKSSKKK
ncbi:MAG: hypothetical protein KDJ26_00775 [Alphaproteobacteria bacterium]|jgi:hypothetical protein|nr:hypothetical protein [Alphaproteobacteria bacterium]MCB1550511.1 hypothetical protein [Alphaproteobacteria bacterium]MCB9985150.1 hypothetical protein [Micavibrio sp.]HPQ50859.1 hypothetical protein [Alphaproteobacteria bacterium]HRK98046.1 hypothetical protein [Alphaproteobacteria bacterium]